MEEISDYSIGVRLRKERERLGWSQDEFGALMEATRQTVSLWEKGENSPKLINLARLAPRGLDVLYVATGQRALALPMQATLPKDALALLNNYDLCTKDAKKNLLQISALLATGLPAGGSAMSNTGDNSVQIGSAKGDVVMGNGNKVIGKRK